jgi:hypothetical protein
MLVGCTGEKLLVSSLSVHSYHRSAALTASRSCHHPHHAHPTPTSLCVIAHTPQTVPLFDTTSPSSAQSSHSTPHEPHQCLHYQCLTVVYLTSPSSLHRHSRRISRLPNFFRPDQSYSTPFVASLSHPQHPNLARRHSPQPHFTWLCHVPTGHAHPQLKRIKITLHINDIYYCLRAHLLMTCVYAHCNKKEKKSLPTSSRTNMTK